ncbi:MAG: hypothetical protein JWP75_2230 [Frondihabitans sp.]|nr:hypothetical protein [Frondihabitans sp.]
MSLSSEDEWALDAYTALAAGLEPIGRSATTGGYDRLAWTAADLAARAWFTAAAAAAGLDVETDGNGNLWGWWGRDLPGRAFVVGSHLDSVPDGGAHDGPLGVIAALAAVAHLRDEGWAPSRPLAVAAFSDEEGGRFGIACAGSRLLTGALDPSRARDLVDRDGVTLAAAMTAAGADPSRLGPDPERVASLAAYVELHIEQGHFPLARPAGSDALGLAGAGAVLGVGTEIWPHGRWRIDVEGEANHAGATRMEDRNDPLLPAATAVLALDEAARRHDALGTVGRIEAVPGAVNAIAARATIWMDVRGADEERVRAVVADVSQAAGHEAVQESWTASTPFAESFTAGVAEVIAPLAGASEVPWLPCGAGHDAGVLAQAGVPSAMIFVRNGSGVSHAPRESVDASDCAVGVLAVTRLLRSML